LQIDHFFLVNHAVFLSPLLVLLLIRRFCVIAGICAIPVLIIFALRMHHVWQFYWFGINSMATQKGDDVGWLTLVFDMLSTAIATPWLLGIFFWKMIDGVERAWRG
jgi:hypothetical protein